MTHNCGLSQKKFSVENKSVFFHPEEENIHHDKENYVRCKTLSIVLNSATHIHFHYVFAILLNLVFLLKVAPWKPKEFDEQKSPSFDYIFSLEEIQDLHTPFTQTTEQTDEDDGAVITALNNTGSFL